MRITKQRRAFIDACKKDFDKQKATPKVLAKLYTERFDVFKDDGQDIIGLVEIAINEYVKENGIECEFSVNLGLLKINK